jgi:RNase P/RNase MRP subunit p30
MDLVYTQPLKELLQMSVYFKEPTIVLVENEKDEKVAKLNTLIPCYLITESTTDNDIQKLKGKLKAVVGGSIKANELAVKIKADFLLSPSNSKQFFDLSLAKKLSDNNTTVVLMFEELIKLNSFERHLYWKNYTEVAKYCKIKKTKFIVASACKDPLHVRPKIVREDLALMLGYPKDLAKNSIEQEFK